MPKDRTENINRYKVRGGQFNDYQRQRDEIALTQSEGFVQGEQEGEWLEGSAAPRTPETEAERIRTVIEDAHKKAAKKKSKVVTSAKAKKPASKASAKPAGKKKTAAKASAKKAGAQRPSRVSAKKTAAKTAPKRSAKTAVAKSKKASKRPRRKS